MSPTTVHLLDAPDWPEYRQVRLDALQQAPRAFASTYADEAGLDEEAWQDRMVRARRLVARVDDHTVGVVSVGTFLDEPSEADLFGLWVAPAARQTGTARVLVEAAAAVAARDGRHHLYYWVGSDNAPAIGLAINLGFRVTSHRRPARTHQHELGPDEVAFVLALEAEAGLVPNLSRVC